MVPYEKLRTPQIQAEYWVQGRTKNDIAKKISELKDKMAYFLAECIESANPQKGPVITNAIPGLSWHQWGEAIDCYWLKDRKACWDFDTKDSNNRNGYKIYANEATKLGLDAGYFWENMIDAVHVQFRKEPSPLNIYSIRKINGVMKDFYGIK